jgi:hypothetical protein
LGLGELDFAPQSDFSEASFNASTALLRAPSVNLEIFKPCLLALSITSLSTRIVVLTLFAIILLMHTHTYKTSN